MEDLRVDLDFEQALKTLGIEKYHDRIWGASPTGELFHTLSYTLLAQDLQDNPKGAALFKKWFSSCMDSEVDFRDGDYFALNAVEIFWNAIDNRVSN